MTLLEIQRAIQRTVSEAKLSDYEDLIDDAPPLSAEDRVLIYINAYFSRLAEALQTDFKFTYRTIGSDHFEQFVTGFLLQYPSHSFTIEDLGSNLEQYIRSHRLISEHPFLADLAALEWAHLQAFFADNLSPLNLAKLQEFTPQDWNLATITLDPTVRIVKSGWNFAYLWEKADDENILENHPPDAGETFHLVYREGQDIFVEVMAPEQAELLLGFQNQETLENVCERIDTKEIPIGMWFSEWMEKGIFRDIQIVDPYANIPCTD